MHGQSPSGLMMERRRELVGDDAREIRHGRASRRMALAGGILAADVAVLLLAPLPAWAQVVLGIVALGALLVITSPFRDWPAR